VCRRTFGCLLNRDVARHGLERPQQKYSLTASPNEMQHISPFGPLALLEEKNRFEKCWLKLQPKSPPLFPPPYQKSCYVPAAEPLVTRPQAPLVV